MNIEKRNTSVYMALGGLSFENGQLKQIKNPVHNIPNPNKDDYASGYITRYFVKKINENIVYETILDDYDSVDLSYWQKVSLNWKISGNRYTIENSIGIEPYNNEQISNSSVSIPEIKNLLVNPIQFARIF